MKNGMVSVVVPVYNVEKYLSECLDSLLNQTCRQMEIICVNDGSTDGSPKILQEYAERDDRIIIVDQKNAGLSAARNAGIDRATGEYIYFLDSDDMIDAEAIDVLKKTADSERLDMLLFDRRTLFEDESMEGRFDDWRNIDKRSREYGETVSGMKLFAEMYDNHDYRPNATQLFTRRSFLEENGLRFYDGILHEDELFTFIALLKAKRATHRAYPFYQRRVRSNSIMTVPKTYEHFRGYFICFREMLVYAMNQEFDREVEGALWNRILQMRRNAFSTYYGLPKTEKKGICWTDDGFSHALFKMDEYLQVKDLETRVKDLETSRSYKIGRALTSPLRWFRDLFNRM